MRNIVAAVVVGLGTLVASAPAQASWLSEALRNTHVNVNLGPSYGPGCYPQPVYVAPPCAPVYVAPPCNHGYPVYRSYNRHDHHDRYEYRGRGDFRGGEYRGRGNNPGHGDHHGHNH